MSSPRSADTSPGAEAVQQELIRRMSFAERAERMTALTLAVQELAFAGMKLRHPEADDDEIWLRLAANRLGRALVKKVYGFDGG